LSTEYVYLNFDWRVAGIWHPRRWIQPTRIEFRSKMFLWL